MAERTTERDRLAAKIGTLSDREVAEMLDHVDALELARARQEPAAAADDDLISKLADTRESRRARVVVEWDRVRRRAERAGFPALVRGATA